MSTKLYVGNLSFNTSNEDLQELFGQAGTVETVNIVEDRDTVAHAASDSSKCRGKKKQNSYRTLNGKEVDGRQLTLMKLVRVKNAAVAAVEIAGRWSWRLRRRRWKSRRLRRLRRRRLGAGNSPAFSE
jgi:hypothetical protein